MKDPFHRFAQFEQLEDRVLMSTTPGPFPGALLVSLSKTAPAVVSSTISAVGKQDVYAFVAPATGQLNIDMSIGSAALLDCSLTLYDSKGNVRASSPDIFGMAHDSDMIASVTAGETLYVKASGDFGTLGTYRLAMSMGDDVGNTLATAKPLVNYAYGARAQYNIDYAGDQDVYSYVSPVTGWMMVTMSPATQGSHVMSDIAIADSNGTELTDVKGTTVGNTMAELQVTAGQTYYIKLNGTNWTTGAYALAVLTASSLPSDPTPAPGASVTVQELMGSAAGTRALQIVGTAGDDAITVSQSGGVTTLTAGSYTWSTNDKITAITIYGCNGNDTIRITNTVTASVTVWAGNGNKTIYDAGAGTDALRGGTGNDEFVTIGGGKAVIYQGTGTDSFWVDANDVITGATAAERAAGDIHLVSSFYQPYTSNPASGQYVSLQIAGQTFSEPDSGGYAYRSFSGQSLFGSGPKGSDIQQGQVGDCYFMSTLASLADEQPAAVQQMITALGDGTYAVGFYTASGEVFVRVDGYLPVYSNGQLVYAGAGANHTYWAALVEKAYAYFRTGQNSYASLNGGWMGDVVYAMTGHSAGSTTTNISTSLLATYISSNLSQGHAMTAGSNSSISSSAPIVGNHAYEIKSITTTGGTTFVTVYNPWGVDGRTADSNSSDGLITLSIADFERYFTAVVTTLV